LASLFEAEEASVGSISLSATLLDDAADEDALLVIRFLLLLKFETETFQIQLVRKRTLLRKLAFTVKPHLFLDLPFEAAP